MPPISTAGDRLEWKKAQNTLKKANASLTINKIKPIIIPFCTCFVWAPSYEASLIISLNQRIIPIVVIVKPSVRKNPP